MEIFELKLTDLVLDPANARKHGNKNLEAIKGSLSKFGQQKPIVVTKNNIIVAGNGTVEAARSLNWETIKAVRTELSGINLVGFGIADNRTSELAEWDIDILGKLIDELKKEDFELSDIGLSDDDINAILDSGVSIESNVVDDPEIDFSEEIGPLDHYMLILFDNKEQYEKYSTLFGVERVKANISGSNHENFFRFGDSRVLPVAKLEGALK